MPTLQRASPRLNRLLDLNAWTRDLSLAKGWTMTPRAASSRSACPLPSAWRRCAARLPGQHGPARRKLMVLLVVFASALPILVSAALPGETPLKSASFAVFKGQTVQVIDQTPIQFEPARLVRVDGNEFALISPGSYVDANAACHACTGFLRIDYVVKGPFGFEAALPPIAVTIPGDGWGNAPAWTVSAVAHPVLRVKWGYAGMGCVDESSEEWELLPDRILELHNTRRGSEDCAAR